MRPSPDHDLDDSPVAGVEKLPTPWGRRDLLDQVEEIALLLGAGIVLTIVLVVPVVFALEVAL